MITKPVNVILIMTDQWRGDCLSIAGHPVMHIPYLEGLGQREVRFTTTPPWIPTRAGMNLGDQSAWHNQGAHI